MRIYLRPCINNTCIIATRDRVTVYATLLVSGDHKGGEDAGLRGLVQLGTALGRLHTQVHPSFGEEYAREALDAHESCANVELQQRVGCGCIAQARAGG